MILYTLEDKDSSYNLQSINNKIAEAEEKLKIKKKINYNAKSFMVI